MRIEDSLDTLAWDQDGLLPVVIQDAESGDVLTLAHANRAAVRRTIETKQTVLYSRSRQAQWVKGETSGNTQRVVEVKYDCDADALLYRVVPAGPACHTGADTCFHRTLWLDSEPSNDQRFHKPLAQAVEHLENVIEERRGASPETSYVAKLFSRGLDRCAQKVGEEAVEVVIAAKNPDDGALVEESADLLFHLLVLLAQRGVPLDRIGETLLRRAGR